MNEQREDTMNDEARIKGLMELIKELNRTLEISERARIVDYSTKGIIEKAAESARVLLEKPAQVISEGGIPE